MRSKSPCRILDFLGYSIENSTYSGFYYTPDLEQKTGLRNPVVFLPENFTIRGLAPCV
jgi:hypothetical protein